MKILIRGTVLDGQTQDVVIEGSKIQCIGENLNLNGSDIHVIDGEGTAAVPSFFNAHTHSPMVLLRGCGDDMPLMEWLQQRIWPLEGQFTEEDFYWGNRLAILEMIRGGTGFFNEMYFCPRIALQALRDSPLKAMIHYPIIDGMDKQKARQQWKDCEDFFKEVNPPEGVQLGVALHSMYASSKESIEWVRDFCNEANLDIHIHISESIQEVDDCRRLHDGRSPVEYLDGLGLLGERVLAAHGVHLSDDDICILAERGVTILHNPVSNMKLANGIFPYQKLKEKNIRILLGTDGAASNNNLDMLEEMKFASLLQKVGTGDPRAMPADEILDIATRAGAERFGTGGGAIQSGKEADIMLVDMDQPQMSPLWDMASSLVYGAAAQSVHSLISAGRIVMENKILPDYQEVRSQAVKCQQRLQSM